MLDLSKCVNLTAKSIGCKNNDITTLSSLLDFSRNCTATVDLLGNSPELHALIWQWFESCSKWDSKHTEGLIKFLNSELEFQVYACGNEVTIADILLYHIVKPSISDATHQEKQLVFGNVSRWFDHMQNNTDLLKNEEKVVFLKNVLYSR